MRWSISFSARSMRRAARTGARELFQRSTSMREALARHPWALPVVDTRAHPGQATLANHEAVLDVLRRSGFSIQATAHAYVVLDAFVYGFAMQEVMLETAGLPDSSPDVLEDLNLARFPRITELATMYTTAPIYPLAASFDIGLNLVLDGIERFTELFPERGGLPDDRDTSNPWPGDRRSPPPRQSRPKRRRPSGAGES